MSKVHGASTEINYRLEQECSPVNEPIPYKEKIKLGYKYDITSQSINDHPEPINFKEDDNVPQTFRHEFEITNEGPSFTNDIQIFSLYVPKILKGHVNLKFQTIPEDQERNVTVDPKKCKTQDIHENLRYQCEIPKGLQKDSRIVAEIEMRFTADQTFLLKLQELGFTSPPKHDEFEFETRLEVMNGKNDATTKSIFKKSETEVGLSTYVKEFWPFILGSLGAIIIFASIMYVAVKKGWHQKVRFTKAKLEKQGSMRK